MQSPLANDNLSSDERANLNESQADQSAAQIMGDNGQGEINLWSQMVTDIMNNFDLSVDNANADMSDPTHGDPWQRANDICATCTIPQNLLHSTEYDIGSDDYINNGQLLSIPGNDSTIGGQLPSSLTYLNDQFNGDNEDTWGNVSYWGGGGDWGGGGGGTCGLVGGGTGGGGGSDYLIGYC